LRRDATGVFFETVSLESQKTERMPAPGQAVRRIYPAWSPDGRFVAYMDAPYANSAVHPLVLLRLADGQAFSITDGRTRIFDATFSPDGRSLYFISNRGGSQDLWHQLLNEDGEPEGEHRRVTTGMGIRSAALSPDGTKLAYSKGRRLANIWKVPILADRPATWAEAQQLTFDQALITFVSVSADRRRLAFSSDRNGNLDLWTLPVDGGELELFAAHPSEDFSPVESPDGSTWLSTLIEAVIGTFGCFPSEAVPPARRHIVRPQTTTPTGLPMASSWPSSRRGAGTGTSG
jgi:dipeptidyl aminopeptidase/acylaminoacyl peptidase